MTSRPHYCGLRFSTEWQVRPHEVKRNVLPRILNSPMQKVGQHISTIHLLCQYTPFSWTTLLVPLLCQDASQSRLTDLNNFFVVKIRTVIGSLWQHMIWHTLFSLNICVSVSHSIYNVECLVYHNDYEFWQKVKPCVWTINRFASEHILYSDDKSKTKMLWWNIIHTPCSPPPQPTARDHLRSQDQGQCHKMDIYDVVLKWFI